ncbi:hypothetical protein A2865_00060 [Candidatus Woesebacteria bacterium RIFCSPHIGHO2_01_FULL_39_17]|uniref:General secretion pathway protein G n=2 Tax=Candidatus Woeseibacteriota TaxID=1752722 RepID=A0A0G0LZ13_9BACT|nr:MAG: hypothetical protein US72_C0022G0023 [Microgenomates group bacterium GW2011_GWC1_38_12]KKQ93250.1 MAG: hypothetical protein UT19_C0015G0011 [Candidatus Woesebacteria bacterium GW2011_GWB1_39_10b]OGM23202.1 MAG: hypothetical protein A2865_00060 [Candidatus Woesebacteria bacterium RIFCSPHIGHO2_01_FULL_39_17]OGM61450.1 MAG: hypothetical protein A3A52_01375 [Candidatus Woesebacteria bacterium RIFCSPLOWO2_01_FULL_39_14]
MRITEIGNWKSQHRSVRDRLEIWKDGLPRINALTTRTRSIREKVSSVRGFTLLELLIVMAILGVLAGVVVVQIGPASQQRARDTIRRNDIKQYQTAIEIYANKNNGNYPTAGNLSTLCGASILNLTGSLCRNDPNSGDYEVSSAVTGYQIWATLEYKPGGTQMYFISCSNGLSGDDDTEPSGTCPL